MRFRRGPEEGLGFEGTPGTGTSGAGGDGAPPPSPSPPPPSPSPLAPSPTDGTRASSDLRLSGVEESPSSSRSPSPPLSPLPRWILEEYEARETEWIEQYLSELRIQEQYPYNSIYPEFHSQLPPDDAFERAPRYHSIGKLGNKERIKALADDFGKGNNIFMEKIRLLREKYDFFRRTDKDGNCFYRAFIFNYLENIAAIQGAAEREIEAVRLRQCVEKSKQAYESLGSLRIPEAQIRRAFSGFERLVHLVKTCPDAESLYLFEKEDGITSRVLPLLRLLTEIEICTREDFYKHFLIPGEADASVFEFCREEVRPENSEANDMQIMALVNALGIPLIVEILDTSSNHGAVQLNQHQCYPRPESEAGQMLGPLNLHGSVSSGGTCCMESVSSESVELLNLPCTSGSSTSSSMQALEPLSIDTDSTPSDGGSGEHHGRRDLSPAETRRLVYLLYRPGHYDILYLK